MMRILPEFPVLSGSLPGVRAKGKGGQGGGGMPYGAIPRRVRYVKGPRGQRGRASRGNE